VGACSGHVPPATLARLLKTVIDHGVCAVPGGRPKPGAPVAASGKGAKEPPKAPAKAPAKGAPPVAHALMHAHPTARVRLTHARTHAGAPPVEEEKVVVDTDPPTHPKA
jgi:hypothetical protein